MFVIPADWYIGQMSAQDTLKHSITRALTSMTSWGRVMEGVLWIRRTRWSAICLRDTAATEARAHSDDVSDVDIDGLSVLE